MYVWPCGAGTQSFRISWMYVEEDGPEHFVDIRNDRAAEYLYTIGLTMMYYDWGKIVRAWMEMMGLMLNVTMKC